MFLVHLGPSPRISHFSKNLQFPLMDNWMKGHNLDVTGCILLPFLWIELGKTAWASVCVCVCVCVCMNVYVYISIYEVKWKSFSRIWLGDPVDYTIHGILQVRILERVAIPFSRGSSQPRNRNRVFCIAGWFFTSWATRESYTYIHTYIYIILCPYDISIQ